MVPQVSVRPHLFWGKWKPARPASAVYAAIVLLSLLMAAIFFNTHEAAQQRKRAEDQYVHTLSVLLASGELKSAMYAALRGERGYLLTRDPKFLTPYEEGRRALPLQIRELRALTKDDPIQHRKVERLEAASAKFLDALAGAVALEAADRHGEAVALVRSAGKPRTDALLQGVRAFERSERQRLDTRGIEDRLAEARIERQSYSLIAAGIVLLLIVALTSTVAVRAQARAERAAADLRLLATTDELTGLANRRHFMAALEREVSRADRAGGTLAMAILDADHFKQINDAYGHAGGDEVLRQIARLLQAGTRTVDTLGRIGGEEFALLMPETTREQAQLVCERLCRTVEARPVTLEGHAARVTISTGVAVHRAGEIALAFSARADRALYAAKHNGRNQVKLAA